MSTLLDIKTTVALYLGKTVADLTIGGFDLGLEALNQVRRRTELAHDFEFSRKLVTVSVDGSTGGDLTTSVAYGTATAVDIKTVIEIGVFDDQTNLRPIEWTTVAEGLERQRKDRRLLTSNWRSADVYPSPAPCGVSRLELSGTRLNVWPKTPNETFVIGLEVYSMQTPWTSGDLVTGVVVAGSGTSAINGTYTIQGVYNGFPLFLKIVSGANYVLWNTGTAWKIAAITSLAGTPTDFYSFTSTSQSPVGAYANNGALSGTVTVADGSAVTSDNWTKYAAEYLTWAAVEHLNIRYKFLVPRTEGNLPPPSALAAQALDAFIEWDSTLYEGFRRHSR